MSQEAQIGLLVKLASLMAGDNNAPTNNLLQSYYLMRCREVTKGYGLPERYFSSKIRCPHCYSEWSKSSDIKVHAMKLSKKQKLRLKHYKINKDNKEYALHQKDLLKSNKIECLCTLCKKITTIPVLKPKKLRMSSSTTINKCDIKRKECKITQTKMVAEISKKNVRKIENNNHEQAKSNTNAFSIYSKTNDVFSLANKNNTLQSNVKEPKVIKNNKRKKDKFAGLCQQAVLASAKLKDDKMKMENEKQNKLNLFLKPL